MRAHCIGKMRRLQSCVQAAAAVGSRGGERLAQAEGDGEAGTYTVPFIRAISDTSPTSKLNVTLLQPCATEPQRRRPQPRTTDSGVQLPQRRYLRNVGGKRPSETILAKQPARPPSMRSGGGTEKDRARGDVQTGDGGHRGNECGEPARQRIPGDVSAAPRAASAVQRHNGAHWARIGVREGVLRLLRIGET